MIKKKVFGNTLKAQLTAGAKDRLYRFLLADGTIRGALVNGTRMVNEMRWNHELGILETLVLGRAYLGCGLMSANLKGNDRVSLQIECSGPIKGLSVEANAFNEVRGYLKNVPIPIENPMGDFDLSSFFGAGFLTVTRYPEDAKQPFSGKVMLKYGNIAKDLAHYFLVSEQLPTAFNLSIKFDSEGSVSGAGGLFLQAMPGADDKTTAGLENLVLEFPALGVVFAEENDPEALVRDVFSQYSPLLLGSRRIEFMCHCNEDRIRTMLTLLSIEELKDILENGPFPVEIRCHNCNTDYLFNKPEIRAIYGSRFPNN
jgi:molecular chaperone Hsp33